MQNTWHMVSLYRFILILVVACLYLGCKNDKSDHNPAPFYKLNENLHPLLFEINSYWVYENDSTSEIDSVKIHNIKWGTKDLGPLGPGQGSAGYSQYCEVTYSSTINLQNDKIYFIGYVISRSLDPGGNIYLAGKNVGESNMNATIEAIFDSLVVDTNIYYDVVKMRIHTDQFINESYNLYFADSIGLVKKEMILYGQVNEIWSLIEFNATLLNIE